MKLWGILLAYQFIMVFVFLPVRGVPGLENLDMLFLCTFPCIPFVGVQGKESLVLVILVMMYFCFISLCLVSYLMCLAISSRCASVVGIQGKECCWDLLIVLEKG